MPKATTLARNTAEHLAGLVERVTFHNPDSGFCVLRVKVRGQRDLAGAASDRSLILRRRGLGRLAALDPKPTIVRYQRERPGELVHIDIKKLGKIDGIGHRITGNRASRARGVGWDFLHVCVDDASRLADTEILPDERKESAVGFLKRALAWFATLGVAVERVMADKAPPTAAIASATPARPPASRQAHPTLHARTNGEAERFIQTSIRDSAYRQAFTSSAQRAAAMRPWLHAYNRHRPHSALGGSQPSAG